MTMIHKSDRNGAGRVWQNVVLFLALSCVAALGGEPARRDCFDTLGAHPADSIFVASFNVDPVLNAVRRNSGRIAEAIGENEWREGLAKMSEALGFDLMSAESTAGGGWDTSVPVGISMKLLSGPNLEPEGALISFGISNAMGVFRTLSALGRVADTPLQTLTGGLVSLGVDDTGVVCGISREALWVGVADTVEAAARIASSSMGVGARLSGNDEFARARAYMPTNTLAAFFMNFKTLQAQLPPMLLGMLPPALKNIEFASAGVNERSTSTLVSLRTNAEVQQLLRSGSASKNFVTRFPQPILAATMSLKQPVRALSGLLNSIDPSLMDNLAASLADSAEMTLDQLETLLADGAAGIMIYDNPDAGEGDMPVKIVAFVKVNDPAYVLSRVKAMEENQIVVEHAIGDTTLYIFEDEPVVALGVVDGYLVVGGNALEHLVAVAEGSAAPGSWTTALGSDAVFVVEIDSFAYLKAVLRHSAAAGTPVPFDFSNFEALYADIGRQTMTLSAEPDGLLWTTVIDGDFDIEAMYDAMVVMYANMLAAEFR